MPEQISATITPSGLAELLGASIQARMPVLITGAPGIGKTDIVVQAARRANADIIISHPVVSDPTDAKGLPWVAQDQKSASFLPFGDTSKALAATGLTVWFLDDLGQAPNAVQASYMQPILSRQIGEYQIPDCVVFVAASNRRADRAGVTGMLEPVKSRFVTIVELEVAVDDWCAWAYENDIAPEIIAFIRCREELLHQFDPTADLTNSPSPRTWKHVNDILNFKLSSRVEYSAIAGAVGKGPAVEFRAFAQLAREVDIDAILRAPKRAHIPTQPSALYAVAVGLAGRADVDTFEAIATYADRLTAEGHGEMAVLTLRDAVRRNSKVTETAAFKRLATSEVGKMFTGFPSVKSLNA